MYFFYFSVAKGFCTSILLCLQLIKSHLGLSTSPSDTGIMYRPYLVLMAAPNAQIPQSWIAG